MSKHLISLVMAVGLATPMVALAEDDSAGSAPAMHRGMEMMHSARIAKALNLNDADTAKLTETMRPFADQRKPLVEQMKAAHQTLRAAADGDVQAQNQTEDALTKMSDLRTQLAAIRKAEFTAVTKGMTPQNRAKVALAYAGHGHGMKDRQAWHHRGQDVSPPTTAPAAQQ